MEILFLFIGLVLGGVLVYLWMNGRLRAVDTQLVLMRQQDERQFETIAAKDKDNQTLTCELNGLREQLVNEKMNAGRLAAQLHAEQEHHGKQDQLRQEQFQQQIQTVQEQFSNLATKVLEQSSEKLKSTNSEAMENITRPLQEHIKLLREAIKSTNENTTKTTASLSEQLRAMSEQTQKIDQTATRLTNVIRGGNKTQGNWGERMLTDILDAQGYRQGIDYDIQHAITDEKGNAVANDESGKRMIPDVVLHYPNNEDVVIDAKMSIESYYMYVNTDDEALKQKYADDLVRSIRTQAVNLARKDYSRYISKPRKAIDFVIMFVPNDGALQLALLREPRIWREAFDRHVFITGQQNLMAILKIIQIAWRQYAQTENQKKVFDMADELMKRIGEFIKRFDKVKKDIDMLSKDYDDAYNKAYTGRQSIVQKANELKSLGAKESANYPIPETETDLLEDNG